MSYLEMAKKAEARLRAEHQQEADPMRQRYPHLDWDRAMSLCIRCGWWGLRDDWEAHKATDEHQRADEIPL